MTKIKFNNGVEEKTLIVNNIFSYTYNAIKTVLKIEIDEHIHSYDEIAELKKCTGKIEVYDVNTIDGQEIETLISEYTGYDLGESGFVCNNANSIFNVELTQAFSFTVRLANVEAAIEEILMMLME